MNQLEHKMLDILKRGRDNFGYVGVKAEFEAEGTRMDEMLRLIDITRRAGLNLGIKTGGCEAVRDLIDCKQIGADYVIAPMIESAYALSKFVQIRDKLYTAYERKEVQFLFNVETKTGLDSLESILKTATKANGMDGIVFGRVDFSGSCSLPRERINDDQMTNDCITVARACNANNLLFLVGGGVTLESLGALRKIHKTFLTRFETRKIIFDAKILKEDSVEQGLLDAIEFELCWLQNKRQYYAHIASEDVKRIEMLENRLNRLKAETDTASNKAAVA